MRSKQGIRLSPSTSFLVMMVTGLLASQPSWAQALSTSQADLANHSVVLLRDAAGAPIGGGIIIGRARDRLLVATADHVVRRGDDKVAVTVALRRSPEKRLAARVLEVRDTAMDLAIVDVSLAGSGVDACSIDLGRLGDVVAVKRGDVVYPLGHPNGVTWALPVIPDRVSAITSDALQFQSQFVSPGHSGGALLDRGGLVLGMMRADQPPFGVAVRADAVLGRVAQWGLPSQLFRPLANGRRPVHAAADAGDVRAIQRELDDCGRIDDATPHNETPLHFAAMQERIEAIQFLLARGAKPNIADGDGDTPLHWAIEHWRLGSVAPLLKGGADPNHANRNEQTPLYRAINVWAGEREQRARERPGLVRALIAAGARPGSALAAAVSARQSEIVAILLEAGAQPETSDLSTAIQREDTATAKLLLAKRPAIAIVPRPPPKIESPPDPPLNLAIEKRLVEVALLMIDAGADPDVPGWYRRTALVTAMQTKLQQLEKLLIARGAGVGQLDQSIGETLLLDCIVESRPHAVRVLLKAGVNPNSTGGRALVDTLLEIAIKNGDAESVGLLAQAGADVNRWRVGSPLTQAVRRADATMVGHLLRAGANPNEGGLGPHPLQAAVEVKSLVLVKMLIDAGARVTAGSHAELIQRAAQTGNAEIERLVRTATNVR